MIHTQQDRRATPGRTLAQDDEHQLNEHDSRHMALTHSGRFGFGTTATYVQRENTRNHSRDIQITNTTAKTSAVIPLDMHLVTMGLDFSRESLEDNTTNRISDITELSNDKWAFFVED